MFGLGYTLRLQYPKVPSWRLVLCMLLSTRVIFKKSHTMCTSSSLEFGSLAPHTLD